ncbi:MAG: NADH-quinone oxidoreductase subunit N [bacterium]
MGSFITANDLRLIFPQLAMAVFIVAILLSDLMFRPNEKGHTAFFSFVAVAMTGYFVVKLWGAYDSAFGGMVLVDNFSLFFNLIFLIGCALTILLSPRYLNNEEITAGEYYVIILIATFGMMIMASAGNLLMVFLGIEVLSIALYVLAGINRRRLASGEAALKYLLLGAFATGFLLYGIAMIYGATGTIELDKIAEYLGGIRGAEPLLTIGIILLLVGFGFKASLVPFHFWTPDVYQGAPTPGTALMSTGAKAAAFAVLFRVFATALPTVKSEWWAALWVLAVLTMSVANVTALWQDNVKRMLAYSSIAHAGYLLVAVLAGGEMGNASLLYYLMAYTLMNMGAFGVVAAMGRKGEANEGIESFRGIGYRKPFMAALMTWFMLSLGGIPPTAGFVAKLYVFAAGVRADMIPLVVIAVINAVVSIYYYLRVVVVMYMSDPETHDSEHRNPHTELRNLSGFFTAFALILCAAGILALGIYPSFILKIVQTSILTGF